MAEPVALRDRAVPHAGRGRHPPQPHAFAHVARALGQPHHRLLLTLLQGHPTFVFWPAHVANHHRFRHGPRDMARTYRFGGDHNHLLGYLLHPLQAGWVLYPLFLRWLGQLRRHWPGAFRYCMGQYLLWLGSWALLLSLDWQKALLLVIVPQLHGLHWLLATNYLQHAHADGRPLTRGQRLDSATPLNYARNFEGWVNPLLFNIGLHTAHHERPQATGPSSRACTANTTASAWPLRSTKADCYPTWPASSCSARSGRRRARVRKMPPGTYD